MMACLGQGEGCRRYIFNIVAPFIPHRLLPPYAAAPVQSVAVTSIRGVRSSSGLSVPVDPRGGITANSFLRALELRTCAYASRRDQHISSLPLTALALWRQVWVSTVSHVTRPVKSPVWIGEMVWHSPYFPVHWLRGVTADTSNLCRELPSCLLFLPSRSPSV